MVNIFSPVTSSRLLYVLGVIFRDHLRVPYRLSADRSAWINAPAPKINYSDEELPGGLHIVPSGLLGETGLRETGPPEEVFGAVFFFLSRYEEYQPGAVYDALGRFNPLTSWAGRQGLLERPLVDEWIHKLGASLGLEGGPFRFSATYDIDQPWCYQNKGLKINLLSAAKALALGRWSRLQEQRAVLTGRKRDPFDNFDWMDQANQALPDAPVYFFPLAASRNAFDKNPPPGNPAYQALIRAHGRRYPLGIHPSFHTTTTPSLLSEEMAVLARITGLPVTISRYHYIRFRLPEGYRLLLANGIRADYSMGYGECNGFRAAYSRPFPWYDLEKETETALQVVPFCWMEATSFHMRHQDRDAALAELEGYGQTLQALGGRLTTIWHNSSLNETPRWIGWRSLYRVFLTHIVPTLPL
jgi:hypothetical protein